jgi:hypothetical protein
MSAEQADPASAVFRRWQERGVLLHGGASRDAITAFESYYGLSLPESFARLLLLANGTKHADRELIQFWSLPNSSSPESGGLGIVHLQRPTARSAHERFVAFADYASYSSLFLLKFSGGISSGVFFNDTDTVVADSFDSFLQYYLQRKLPWGAV